MANRPLLTKVVKVVFWCALWYTFGSLSSVVSKIVLKELPYPNTLTMAHLMVAVASLTPGLTFFGVEPVPFLSRKFILWRIFPLALGKILASISSHISLWKVPISYAHTVKAIMPLFTVSLSVIVLKERPTFKICISLVPIMAGVLIATVTEVQFNIIGMIAALMSTLFFALQNVYSKKSLKEVKIHHLRLLLLLSQVACLMLGPFWLFGDLWSLTSHRMPHASFARWVLLLVCAGLLNLGQNVCAFSVLSFMSPTSYSVANVTKRISVIVVSLLLMRNPVTVVNVAGMAISISGVLLYNKAKFDSRRQEDMRSLLPLHETDAVSLKGYGGSNTNKHTLNGTVTNTEVLNRIHV